MNHWGHFLAVAAAVLVIGAVLVAQHWAHQQTAAQIYSSFIDAHWPSDAGAASAASNTYFATDEQREILLNATRDSARHANSLHFEANVWAALFVVLLFVLLFYHAWSQRSLF